MGKKLSCVIIVGNNSILNKKAIDFAKDLFKIKCVVNFTDSNITEAKIAALKPDYVFNFLSEKILKGAVLEFKNVNFHPALPHLPGRGSASIALYNGDKYFGATAHIMVREVDAGDILAVERFNILPDELCEDLFARGQNACLELFKKILKYIVKYNDLPKPCGEVWTKKPMTKKEFQRWLVLDEKNKNDFIKKIKAARHSKFPGPYIFVHGYKFGLMNEQI